MPTVFISHSAEDSAFVEREILPVLDRHHIRSWYSPASIQTSEEWERAIKRGLEASDWFLIALSPRAAKSKWVRAEIGWAFQNREGRIIPVLIEACDPVEVHLRLNDLQFTDFRRDVSKGAEQLVKIFETLSSTGATAPRAVEETSGTDVSMLKALAHTMMLKGDYDEAITELSDAVELAPNDSGAFVLRGTCYLQKGDWNAAISDLSRAISGSLNPLGRSQAYTHRGRAHFSKGDQQLALADYDAAIDCDPNNGYAYLLRGDLRRLSLDRKAALADLTEAVRLIPSSADALILRAHVLAAIGDTEGARADYAAAAHLDPKIKEKIPAHFQASAPSGVDAGRMEDALRSLRAYAAIPLMDSMSPAAKVRALQELWNIGFPKILSDLEYLVANLPKESNDYKAASIGVEWLRKEKLGP